MSRMLLALWRDAVTRQVESWGHDGIVDRLTTIVEEHPGDEISADELERALANAAMYEVVNRLNIPPDAMDEDGCPLWMPSTLGVGLLPDGYQPDTAADTDSA